MKTSTFRNMDTNSSTLPVGGVSQKCLKVKLFFPCLEKTTTACAGPVQKQCSIVQKRTKPSGLPLGVKGGHRLVAHGGHDQHPTVPVFGVPTAWGSLLC